LAIGSVLVEVKGVGADNLAMGSVLARVRGINDGGVSSSEDPEVERSSIGMPLCPLMSVGSLGMRPGTTPVADIVNWTISDRKFQRSWTASKAT
jgi:hypothetical protein